MKTILNLILFITVLYMITIEKLSVNCDTKYIKRRNQFFSSDKLSKNRLSEKRKWIKKSIKLISPKNCGLNLATNYIVNGEDAVDHKYPFIALIYVNNSQICGASIINEWWLLTAAHCMFDGNYDASHYYILAGSNKPKMDERYNVQQIIVRRKITLSDFGSYLSFDIALIRVRRKIGFNSRVNAICMPHKQYSEPLVSGIVTVAGWGVSKPEEFDANGYVIRHAELPNTLKTLDMRIISDQQCANLFAKNNNYKLIFSSMLCCKPVTANSSACNGDSGGPAFQYINGRSVLIGVTSFGGSFCRPVNGVYVNGFTQVSYFLDWIAVEIHQNTMRKKIFRHRRDN